MHTVPSTNPFSLTEHVLFRAVLITFGWIPSFSHLLKARIRKRLMLGRRPVPVSFRRRLQMEEETLTLTDEVRLDGSVRVAALSVGSGFLVRYVPQSRYFQSQDLASVVGELSRDQLHVLNTTHQLVLERKVRF